jgi:shikimate kinase
MAKEWRKPRIIVLVGPKHCGKSTVAYALRLQFECRSGDLDLIIEKRTGKSARELFKEDPENFRREEADKLCFVFRKESENMKPLPLVLGTGGGIIDNETAVRLLTRFPGVLIVYLDAAAEVAWARVEKSAMKDGALPAFLANAENPKEAHRVLHEQRRARYKEIAHFTVETDGISPAEAASYIIAYAQTGVPPEKKARADSVDGSADSGDKNADSCGAAAASVDGSAAGGDGSAAGGEKNAAGCGAAAAGGDGSAAGCGEAAAGGDGSADSVDDAAAGGDGNAAGCGAAAAGGDGSAAGCGEAAAGGE